MVFGWFGVSWVMLQFVVGLLACWQGSFGRHRNGYIWLMVPIVYCGAFGGREIVGVLKIRRDPYQT